MIAPSKGFQMARVYSMSWVPGRRGWMKEYKGRKYAVSCRQLNAPETKEGSCRQANAWWSAKKAELDGYVPAPTVPGSPAAVAALLQAWAGHALTTPEEAGAALLDFMHHFKDKPLPPVVVQAALGPERVAQLEAGADRLLAGPPPPPDRSLSAQVERWGGIQQAQVAAGNLTADRCDNNRIALCHFRDWCGTATLEEVDAQRLHDFYLHCIGRVQERQADPAGKAGWSAEYAKKVFATARSFLRFLWESELIPLPRNIDSKAFRFGNGAKPVPTWTVEEVRRVITEAPGKLKLALLLMVNTGATQTDVSDLLDTEVDWVAATITRKRSKTSDHENVPTVCHKLWPVTFALLQKYRSGQGRVLLTESGKPYVRKELVAGKLVKSDNIASNYAHLKRRLGFKKPLKQLRKTSASLLESHPVYGRLTTLFLGHSPRSLKDRHYAAPSQPLLDEAVAWLGEQYGLCPLPTP
jgi:integrase